MSSTGEAQQRHDADNPELTGAQAGRSLRNGLISLAILIALAGGLLLAIPGLHGVAHALGTMNSGWLAAAVVLVLPRYTEKLARLRARGRLHTVLTGAADSINDTKRLLFHPDWRLFGAIGYLWFDIGVLVACFAALGASPPLLFVVLAYQIGYISNFIPTPGNIGVLDASLVGMLVLFGVNATTATAATLVYHAIALWIPALWGTIAFLIVQRTKGQPLKLREPRSRRRRTSE